MRGRRQLPRRQFIRNLRAAARQRGATPAIRILSHDVKQLSPLQLKDWLADASQPAPVLLDVREPWEYEICRIAQSINMPMQTVTSRLQELEDDANVVVICHHGARSQQVAAYLVRNGYEKIFNLEGGIDAWSDNVDPTVAKY
jgi:rhodanese-related sulfurtransferase